VNEGRSNRDIGRALFISPRTVEMHVSNALTKLGCSTRTEAAHRARARGVLA
jgi:DNA-binding NarL/FixJ family response regulator